MKVEKITFSDREMATIIWNSGFPYLKRKELLSDLREQTGDETLRRQIDENLSSGKDFDPTDSEDFILDRFELGYVDFPHPFKSGSFVRNIETKERGIVSLAYPGYQKESGNRLLRLSDSLIPVEYLDDRDYTFKSTLTAPWLLEYDYDNTDHIQKMFSAVKQFYKGEIPISELQHQFRILDKYKGEEYNE